MQQQNASYSFHPQPLTKNYFRAVAKKIGGENRVGHIKKVTSRDVTFSLYFSFVCRGR